MTVDRYVVLGAGRQGTACAYDLAFAPAPSGADAKVEIVLADAILENAEAAAERIRSKRGEGVEITAKKLDAGSDAALRDVLDGAIAAASCVPYRFGPAVARAAVDRGVHLSDLGGSPVTRNAMAELDAKARDKGVAIMPDCGLAPGIGNTLMGLALLELGGEARSIIVYCGGLPEEKVGPLEFRLLFHPAGLTNEYLGECAVLRDGKLATVPSLDELETIDFTPLGPLEAFSTVGGTAGATTSLAGKVDRLDYKTLRYPGHVEKIRLLRDLGLLELDAVDVVAEVDGAETTARVRPRELFHVVAGERLAYPEVGDLVVMRAVGVGRDGSEVILEMLEKGADGFTAMERTTGFGAAVVTRGLASGRVEPGVRCLETDLDPRWVVSELATRSGVRIQTRRRAAPA